METCMLLINDINQPNLINLRQIINGSIYINFKISYKIKNI